MSGRHGRPDRGKPGTFMQPQTSTAASSSPKRPGEFWEAWSGLHAWRRRHGRSRRATEAIPTTDEIHAMSSEQYLDWLDATGQDVDQWDEADERSES